MAVTDGEESGIAALAGKQRSIGQITLFIAFIILLEVVALSLKVLDDRLRDQGATELMAQKDTALAAEYVSGQIAEFAWLLQFGREKGWNLSRTAGWHENIDIIGEVRFSPNESAESRELAASKAAVHALSHGNRATLSSFGDLVIISLEDPSPLFAVLPTQSFLPEAQTPNSSFRLHSINEDIVVTSGELHTCAVVSSTSLKTCLAVPQPAFSRRDLLNLLVYLLLLIGPALGLAGLLDVARRARRKAQRIEASAWRTEQILSTVMRGTRAGFWSLDQERRRIWMSAEAAALIGLSGEGDYEVERLMHLIDHDARIQVSTAIGALGTTGEMNVIFPNQDRSRWMQMRGQTAPLDTQAFGILLEVTETQEAVRQRQRAEQHLRSALEGHPGPLALWDPDQRLMYWNSSFARVFNLEDTLRPGISRQTVRLAQAASIIERDRRTRNQAGDIVKVANGRWFKMFERETPTGDCVTMGFDITIEIRNEVEQAAQKKKLRQLVSELEHSEMRASDLADKLQDEKIRAENSANSKSAFLANMSHELRTPLNAINGFSEILSNEMYGPLGNPRYREYAKDILASGQHLLDLINDILDMAKIEAGKMTVDLRPINLVDPVDAAIRMIRQKAEGKGIRLRVIANDGLPRVDADHRAVKQMVLNLVSNAIKFTDAGGEIRISVDRKGQEVRVAVRDTGVGIPADALPRIAQPFEQIRDKRNRNYDGTGLGLALTRSFAEMQGGRLTIASEESKGTQASFYLPVCKEDARRSTNAA